MKHMIKAVMIVASLCATGLFEVLAYADDVSANGSTMAGEVTAEGIHAGDVLVRLRAISIEPEVHTSGTLSSLGVGVNNALVPELDLTYMIRDAIGIELILATSRHHVTSGLGDLGGVNVLPPTLLLQYHFNHAGMIRPYVGAGVNYTYFYNDGLSAGSEGIQVSRSSFGPAVQAGVDVQITKTVFLNADIKKIWMHTDASVGDSSLGRLDIDPLVLGIGVGMKF
ncbi:MULTISPECIES: OmpW family protein [unclassified Paraburkholderia]|uniref:OmpW/AlkL family protein n=1 Tax=unclassified Paraburkholderia TaxID=2615204 RepID=UPI00160D43BD|nr:MULTISPECIES: OmpW family outer membrane protein [unclassified Paraburkholderia]MBB5446914.1 outer membrane protein [Paraburkholderia sp. WSM4177]MBB5487434.1 outer membrane protein [Paraburkholderia sp. WSM4180]